MTWIAALSLVLKVAAAVFKWRTDPRRARAAARMALLDDWEDMRDGMAEAARSDGRNAVQMARP